MRKHKNVRRRRVATISLYGPNDHHATKVVAGIVDVDRDDVVALERWMSGKTDVRNDEKIQKDIMAFVKRHNVKEVVLADRIIGCPHEEGPDYPVGEDCPFCPFWAGRDRWTGELKE